MPYISGIQIGRPREIVYLRLTSDGRLLAREESETERRGNPRPGKTGSLKLPAGVRPSGRSSASSEVDPPSNDPPAMKKGMANAHAENP